MRIIRHLSIVAALTCITSLAQAQYFGRNKVPYDKLDFRVAPTPHFDIYFYPSESLATVDAARMAERWYSRHSTLLQREFQGNPLIFYADAPDFQQSNVIEGMIGQGTGGVTEGLRDRVIMPLTGSYAETDHVLGHELVHVFQYRIAGSGASGGSRLERLPLWAVEGMAEYLSIGRNDPNTSMWMRDAVVHNDIPTIKDLNTSSKYFPYRFGEALWAYIGGEYGDDAVARVYRAALNAGWESAVRGILGKASDSLSAQWHAATRAAYADVAQRTLPDRVGASVVRGDVGDMNVAPVVSPDGRRVAFYSDRGLFSIDLYVSDLDGRNVHRLASETRNPHFDALSFIESGGAWSPDGRQFAFVVYAEGDNEIHIVDADGGKTRKRIRVDGIGQMSTPAWSPDGKQIAFSGMSGGISDLYLYELTSDRTVRLTNDRNAQLHPAWSPDGSTIAFATDAGSETSFDDLRYGPMRLALLDVRTHEVRLVPRFGQGKQINPQFSPDGRSLFFISDQDGVSDIYRMTLATGDVARVTNIATGVSGITTLSPALSVAASNGTLVFSVFDRRGYGIRSLSASEATGTAVMASATNAGSLLPPQRATSTVADLKASPRVGLIPITRLGSKRSSNALSLDYVGGPQIGVGVGGAYGTAIGGGIALGFSDILGNHIVNVVGNASGSVRDMSGAALYLDRSHRWTWGVEALHVPISSGFATAEDVNFGPANGNVPGTVFVQRIDRAYYDQAQVLAQYPLSTTRRFELGASAQRIGFGIEYDSLFVVGNDVLDEVISHADGPTPLGLGSVTAAYVTDYSFFGFTSPVSGGRSRLEVSPVFGSLTYQTALADYRRYVMVRPFTIAARGIGVARFGGDAENERLTPLYLGHPSLVRGYDVSSFDPNECTTDGSGRDDCPEFSRLLGSSMAVANVEFRIPLFGTDQFGLLNVPFLPLEVAPFVDAGVTWRKNEQTSFRFDRNTTDRVPVVSAGLTARANLLGAVVVELYWARPFQRPDKSWVFGLQLAPGW